MTRRNAMILAGAMGFGISVGGSALVPGRPRPRLLKSRARLPEPFTVPLPKPPVAVALEESRYVLTQRAEAREILPGLRTVVWGYDGLFPGPTIEASVGRPVKVTVRNELAAPTVTHLHGGVTAPESDGYPTDLLMPRGGAPVVHAHSMRDARAQVRLGERDYVFPNAQSAATLWYHDHRMDFTGQQVWRGLAGFYILRDPAEDALPLPRGEKEIPLMICDRSFDADGSFLYPSIAGAMGVEPEYMGGVLGDVVLVNGAPWPVLEVANTRYRFRVLNASNARRYRLELTGGAEFVQIGSDAGMLAAPVAHGTLPIAPAERFDVIVDFARCPVGSKVILRDRDAPDALANVMCFRVTRAEKDETRIPERLGPGFELPNARLAEKNLRFAYGFMEHGEGWLINGKPFDPARMDASARSGSYEIWRVTTDFHHPVHFHFAQFRVLTHSGHPTRYDSGWKDTVDLGPGQGAHLLMRFGRGQGRYVFHCHNLEHEDMAMMGNFEVI